MGPDVPSPSNMWALVFYLGVCFFLEGCQWVPIESEALAAETATIEIPGENGTPEKITVTYPWFDSMRDLLNNRLDAEKGKDDSLYWRVGNMYIAQWDEKTKKYRYSVRYMSLG